MWYWKVWFDLIWFDLIWLDIPNLTENNIHYGQYLFWYTADLQATSTFPFHFLFPFSFSRFRCSCSGKGHPRKFIVWFIIITYINIFTTNDDHIWIVLLIFLIHLKSSTHFEIEVDILPSILNIEINKPVVVNIGLDLQNIMKLWKRASRSFDLRPQGYEFCILSLHQNAIERLLDIHSIRIGLIHPNFWDTTKSH